eukprot:TRINITY_DN807_c0_g1_i1.p2 TRINITY_DN807_c0_g1~~TRINITY_DN807_c0_g1_i1.p2  ORF type:complete len:399 (-),score=92.80 TRINITY_DN807_c0_g1_i1:93-1289(-)
MGDDERKLFVGKLPDDIGEDEIKMIFNTYGQVSDVRILPPKDDNKERDRRVAFVTYETVEAAKAAEQVLNDVYKFREDAVEPIVVRVARPRNKGKDGKGDGKGKGWNDSYGKGRNDSYGYDRGRSDPYDSGKGGKGGYSDRGYDRGHGGYDRDRGHGGYDRNDSRGNGGYENSYDKGKGGYDRGGSYDRGHSRDHDSGGKGYDRGGYNDRGGYDRGGYDRGGHDRGGYDRGSDRNDRGYDRGGYDRGDRGGDRGYDRGGKGYDKGGGKDYNRNDGGKGDGRRGDDDDGRKLYVANLPKDIDRESLDMVFKTYGTVEDIHVLNERGPSGQSCAFVKYANQHDAKQAIAAMESGYEIRPGEGNIIVKMASTRRNKGDKGDKGKGDYKGRGDSKGKGYAPY